MCAQILTQIYNACSQRVAVNLIYEYNLLQLLMGIAAANAYATERSRSSIITYN